MTMFLPSTYPSSRRPCRNASMRAELAEGEVRPRYPIRGTFPGCCASATAPDIANAIPMAISLRHFRFWILRLRSEPALSLSKGQVLDFSLGPKLGVSSEGVFTAEAQSSLRVCSIPSSLRPPHLRG